MKLKPISMLVRADHWKEFAAESKHRGLDASVNIRQLMAE